MNLKIDAHADFQSGTVHLEIVISFSDLKIVQIHDMQYIHSKEHTGTVCASMETVVWWL